MAQPSPQISQTLPEHWQYISEGGATVVLSYSGPPNPIFDKTVLRLRKSVGDGSNSTAHPMPSRACGEEPDDPMVEFQETIIHRLIPQAYLPRLQTVSVDADWLSRISTAVEAARPYRRREKDHIDLTKRKAILGTDLVGSEPWAVEIKPKWGFLPSPSHLSPESLLIKRTTCRYCMHSHLKSLRGEATAEAYCPLDLFSGDPDRIGKAIGCLWDAWVDQKGRVNNLKVFVEGEIVEPHDNTSMDNLRKVFDHNQLDVQNVRSTFIQTITSILQSTPVLATLSTLQRSLDALDIEGLSSLYSRLNATDRTDWWSSNLLLEPTISEYSSFLDLFLESHSSMDHANPPVTADIARYYTLAYLLSATFKDCSIILRPALFSPASMKSTVDEDLRSSPVPIIDLDMKSTRKFPAWDRLDRAIVDMYRAVEPEKRRICLDGAQPTSTC
ncbi:hypothetical protein JAAARDRAFT_573112 [Jaapia argillacea MUCL 33604]|uniref:Inositol-pentakisphosphate 2-kinase n=1 Tax=Jaapia argillacea MUCL 33604 TaxID=933084 RepID=A0A067Q231_9AGAM|nr:hypothetical protein JAAARDRAFT_573112 [Jaapia argillacea MUCL 33604]